MTIKTKAIFGAMLMVGIAFVLSVGFAYANMVFPQRAQTATATTTPAFMTPGTATSSLIYNASPTGTSLGDSAVLLIQNIASSTNTTLMWRFEYSQDNFCASNPNGSDWYSESGGMVDNQTATTTNPFFFTQGAVEYGWKFASSSQAAGVIVANNNRAMRYVEVPTPTKCVRASFYLPVGSANGAVWAEFVGKKQVQ